MKLSICFVTYLSLRFNILTPDRELASNQSMDTIKVQLGESINFIWLVTEMWMSDLRKSRNDSRTTPSPKTILVWEITHNTAQPTHSTTVWRMYFPDRRLQTKVVDLSLLWVFWLLLLVLGSSSSHVFFQVTRLAWESSLPAWPVWGWLSSSLSCLYTLGEGRVSKPDQCFPISRIYGWFTSL